MFQACLDRGLFIVFQHNIFHQKAIHLLKGSLQLI